MQKSVRSKIAITFIALMALLFLLINVFQHAFLNAFYLKEKEKTLARSWELLSELEDVEAVPESFVQFCSANGLTYCVTDETMSLWTTNSSNGDRMATQLLGILLGKEEAYTEILKETDAYTMIRNEDRFSGIPMLELWGVLPKGGYYLVTCPVQSITDAARIANRFNLLIAIGAGVLGAAVMWLLSGKLEKDLEKLRSEKEKLQREMEEKERMDAMRRDFLSSVSHELKTPIALIQGYAEGLKEHVREDADSREFYTDVILDEAGKMNTLVRQITTLNQIEFGKDALEMETFDLTALIKGVLEKMKVLLEQGGAQVYFEQSEALPVKGDAFRIEEVVTNYLTNALHHLEGDRTIDISCRRSDGNVITTVFNAGSPIPEEELDKIWTKFYKVDKARTRAYGGSGIGLSIVKAIMDAHGQSCGVKNYENGVAFTFSLTESREI